MSSPASDKQSDHSVQLQKKQELDIEGSLLAADNIESIEERARLEKKVWKKLDLWILPIATMFYLLSFLDRSNISNARVAGLQKELGMTNKQYSIALTVTYVPYIVAELPSNLLLKAVGPNLMLPSMLMLWGFVTIMQGLVKSYSGLLACRFFLGLFEGGLFPGLVLYLSWFYPRSRLNTRVSTFFASASLSGAFSGLLAAGIIHLNGKGGRPGWSWIFILEGLFTFLFALISYFILPRSVERARFLSEREKTYVLSVLRADGAVGGSDSEDGFSKTEMLKAFLSPQVWFMAPILFFNGVTLYGLAYFEPSIVASMGYTGTKAQLYSVPPFAAAFVVSMVFAFISDRYRARGIITAFSSVLAIIGFSMFYAAKHNNIRYASLFFSVPGAYLSAPTITTWVANNSAPATRRATAVAIAFILTNAGGITATWLLGSISPAPYYKSATRDFIIMSVLMFVFSIVNTTYLALENRKKKVIREQAAAEGKEKTMAEEPGLGDKSAWFVYTT